MSGCCVIGEVIYYRGTQEYVHVRIEASVLLDTQLIEFSLRPGEWFTATWLGAAAMIREARALVDFGDYYKGEYPVKVRITNLPEIPIFEVGTIEVRL